MASGTKYDAGKLPWDLLPYDAVEKVVEVLAHGAAKYAPNNWRRLKNAESRYFAALMRHAVLMLSGKPKDKDSKLLHVAHMATNAVFLVWFALEKERKMKCAKNKRSRKSRRFQKRNCK